MVLQRLSPGVQHGDRADLGAEVARVGGDAAQRLGRGAEQDGVDHRLVVERDLGDRRRQGEDDVEVGHRQQLGLARLQPLGARQALALRAVPVAAGVVGAADQAAVGAVLDMPAERRRPAGLDRRHDAALGAAEMGRVGLPVRRAVAAEDVRHLQRGTHRRGSGGRRDLQPQPVERARRPADRAGRDLGVARRGLQVAVAEQGLDDADVGAALQQMRGEAVPQRVHRHPLVQPGCGAGGAAGGMQRGRVQRVLRIAAGEQPVRRPRQPPVGCAGCRAAAATA